MQSNRGSVSSVFQFVALSQHEVGQSMRSEYWLPTTSITGM